MGVIVSWGKVTSGLPVTRAQGALSSVVSCNGVVSTVLSLSLCLGDRLSSDKLSERSGSLVLRMLTEVLIMVPTSERMDFRTQIGCLRGVVSASPPRGRGCGVGIIWVV